VTRRTPHGVVEINLWWRIGGGAPARSGSRRALAARESATHDGYESSSHTALPTLEGGDPSALSETLPSGAVDLVEPGGVEPLRRSPHARDADYVFLPLYQNRITAQKIIQRQFKQQLTRAKVEDDPISGMKHTIYSLRHTAICMRIILSQGQVNIFNLAKNAGTSVDQIERFYAHNLPLSKEMAINLQSLGNA
jgi:hypothetical protein